MRKKNLSESYIDFVLKGIKVATVFKKNEKTKTPYPKCLI
jgi:hypothetical protein